MSLDYETQFSMICEIGSKLVAAYTGFSKTEVKHCMQRMSWEKLRSVLFADDMYEAIIMLSMSPMTNVVTYYQLFVGCMLDFSDDHDNTKLKLVLDIIDKEDALDSAVKNTKIVRALLAIKAHYCKSDPSRCCWLFENANRMLAHIFQKYPDFLKLNFVKTNTKVKKFRFTEDDVKKWL